MPGIENNLYPPIFKKSYVPAFNIEVGCKVYFSISIYNSLQEIHPSLVQVTVQNQKTNQSVLSRLNYPSGIMIKPLGIDSSKSGDEKYYIEILPADIEGGFNYNEYYKVQIRFTQSKGVKSPQIGSDKIQKLDSWLNQNLSHFSQWSTVVLIKPVGTPTISLKSFQGGDTLTTITTNDLTIVGEVSNKIGDKEPFKSYRILIYDSNNNLIEDSGDKYFSNSNQIYYNCKYKFLEDVYVLKVQVTTRNLYFIQQSYNFQISYVNASSFYAEVTTKADNVTGCVIVSLENDILTQLGTNIVITRASNKDGFRYWEDMYITLLTPNTTLKLEWRDYTVESGVWYKYAVSKVDEYNFRSVSIESKKPVMALFEDIFLTTKDQQLKIRFDPQVNNYSRVVSESLTETIGSKYPFIRRNGRVDYKTFSISGTITYFSDIGQNLMHSSRNELYGDFSTYYEEYNNSNNINLYNDIIQQKEFREKVLDFLYKNNVKLYKSATQGNILVKLMNISLTPNNNLSRQIYSFTCTAYEIDDFNYENCIKYGIQDCGAFVEQDKFLISKFGQIVMPSPNLYYSNYIVKEEDDDNKQRQRESVENEGSYYFGTGNILNTLIRDKFLKLETEDISISIEDIYYLKIMLTSDPYLIAIDNTGRPYRVENSPATTNFYLGHIVTINGEDIIINKDGIYELSDSNTSITSLSFKYGKEQGVIDFLVNITEYPKKITGFRRYTSVSKIGQLWGGFNLLNNSSDLLYTYIANKYNIYGTNYEQQLQKIDSMCIQAEPGTTFFIRENQDKRYEQHTLNETGLLQFSNPDTDIRGIYILGPILTEVTAEEIEKEGLHEYEFYDTNEVISLSAIRNPKSNYVYSVSPFQKTEEDTLVVDRDELTTEEFEELSQWLTEQENNILWSTQNDEAEELDLETLGLFFLAADKYIYYRGSWYPFTEDHIVITPVIQAIIDYHCKIIIRENS